MPKPIKSGKAEKAFEINWKIKELFSASALSNFINEIEKQYLSIERED
tara:strand:+ start:379 stop:522 length:144 start_codon:yes stop_codon:yes gene_type:complete